MQCGGKCTECHIHLDFYECFDSSPKDTPLTRWRVFIQACQTSKKMRWRNISWFPLLCEEKKERKKTIILIATGNNYLVDYGKMGHLKALYPDHQVWRQVSCNWRTGEVGVCVLEGMINPVLYTVALVWGLFLRSKLQNQHFKTDVTDGIEMYLHFSG